MPIIENLTVSSEALIFANKCDIDLSQARLQSSRKEFATTEPLKAYAIVCQLGLEEEQKMALSYTTSIHLPGLEELPEEFKMIPVTEHHCLDLLHSRYRREIADVSSRTPSTSPSPYEALDALFSDQDAQWRARTRQAARNHFMDCIREGVPLNFESLALTSRADRGATVISDKNIRLHVSLVLDQAIILRMTVQCCYPTSASSILLMTSFRFLQLVVIPGLRLSRLPPSCDVTQL